MEAQITYLYLVYENYKYYKEYNKFYEISLTSNQVEIKDKYIDKDHYEIEFFATPYGYSQKILKYITDKFVKFSFPFNVRKGELQAACNDFIEKCSQIAREKSLLSSSSSTFLPSPRMDPLQQQQKQKLIALFCNTLNHEMTVLCNNDKMVESPAEFLALILAMGDFKVLKSAVIPAGEVDDIIDAFQVYFTNCKTLSLELGLPWYRVTEQEVMHWLETVQKPVSLLSSMMPNTTTTTNDESPFDTDQFLFDEFLEDDTYENDVYRNKKRKDYP